MAESAISHWMPCFSARIDPCEYRFSARSTIMSSATSAWPIQRMQCASRAGPNRACPSRWPSPRPPSILSSDTTRSVMRISQWLWLPDIVSTSRTTSQPSDGMSTRNAELAAWGSSGSSSVRAMRMANCAPRAPEMNHLCPLMTQVSPSG